MIRYLITKHSEELIVLEAIREGSTERNTIQLSPEVFSIIMQYPVLSREELCDKLWEIADHDLGRKSVEDTVDKALAILGEVSE